MPISIKGDPARKTGEIDLGDGTTISYDRKKGTYELKDESRNLLLEAGDGHLKISMPQLSVKGIFNKSGEYEWTIDDGNGGKKSLRHGKRYSSGDQKGRSKRTSPSDEELDGKLTDYLKEPRGIGEIKSELGYKSSYDAKKALERIGAKSIGHARGAKWHIENK